MATTAHKIEEKTRTSDVKLSDKVPFNKMLLSAVVRSGLHRAGYVYPTVLQANAIPIGKAGIDLIVQSKSGTGKTLIFTVIILESIHESSAQYPQALILAPTREIAVQIENTVNVIGSCCKGFKAVSVIGGLDITADRKRIQNSTVIVGTPGRVLHLIKNDVFNTSNIKLFVIDEADKMMSSPFREDFEHINRALPAKKQMIACSATFCNDLDSVLAKYMQKPFLISTEKRSTSLLGIKQLVYDLPEEKTNILEMQAKIVALKDIFSKVSFKQCLIFANSQSRAESYCTFLNKDGWSCEVICGAHDQQRRLEAFHKFREFKTRILIATDLMARGIDSEHVNLVINLELSEDAATYLHRVGRAGRFGSLGIAISFVASKKDTVKLRKILEGIGFGMDILKFPKSQNVDLWNFNDDENEREQLGVFDVNDISECEKENINNNIQTTVNEEKKNSMKRSLEKDIKVLDLIDSRPVSKSPTNRCGNLFSEFIEETNSNTVEKDVEKLTEKQFTPEIEKCQDSAGADREIKGESIKKESLLNLVCDQDKQRKKSESGRDADIFSEFSNNVAKVNLKSPSTENSDSSKNSVLKSSSPENIDTPKDDAKIATKQEDSPKIVTQQEDSPKIVTQQEDSPKPKIKTGQTLNELCNKNIPDDLKDALCSLLVTSKPKKSSENIFDDFKKIQSQRASIEPVDATSTIGEEPPNQVLKAIHDVRSDIITPTGSQTMLNSVCSFSENAPSTSMQPQYPTSTETTNYPSTSANTSDGQTKNDLANISSLTDEFNCPSISSDLKLTVQQKSSSSSLKNLPSRNLVTSSPTPRDASSADTDYTTDTASERNESGFKSGEKSASSGVVSSDHPDEAHTSTTSDSDSSSDSESTTSDSTSTESARHTRRTRRNRRVRGNDDTTNTHENYQRSFDNWTQLYWNQVAKIQDYVECYKYAKKYSSRYS